MFSKETKGTTATSPTPPGCHAAFSVNLKAIFNPSRHQICYWRLTSPDGTKFGDKLWCEIVVVEKDTKDDKMEQSILESKDEFEDVSEHANDGSQASSQMIFPKLPVESPVASTENLTSGVSLKAEDEPLSAPMSITSTGLGEDDSEVEVGSLSDGVESFLTDDEYDVLDASDEEAFQECERIA
jgi:next-to-BRCA1 protein 1